MASNIELYPDYFEYYITKFWFLFLNPIESVDICVSAGS